MLTAAGFPVPGGFVVTSSAYEQFIESAPWLEAAVEDFEYERPDRLREQCSEIRRRLTEAQLTEEVRREIGVAVRQMNAAGASGAFAVRSSSTFEDLAGAAFAGQHDTYLNVRGEDAIVDRIRACFASLWEDRAVHYRHRQGYAQRDAKMAVVIQQQIECEVAGVGFSVDPVNGRMDRMIVDANFGLGESVVSGEGEVDHFEIDKSKLELIQRAIGHKEHQIVATAAGSERRPVPAESIDAACLRDDQVIAIARLMLRVEGHYGLPQDIEWGIAAGVIYLLQSRPVTTIQPDWTRDESAERFPNPMTPLSWDFISVAFRASMSHSLALMGLPPMKTDWFAIFDHYIYGNQNAVRLIGMFRPIRARSAAELVAEIPELRRRFAWVMDLPVNWARDLDRYLIRLGRLQARPTPNSLESAWQLVLDVLGAAEDYFRPNIAISMTQSALYRLLHHLIATATGPEKAIRIVDGLLSGCETKTAIVNREIHEMAELAARDPRLREELVTSGGTTFLEADRLQAYPLFAARFGRFLEDHGHREMDMDYRVPTWSGRPAVALDSLALLLRAQSIEDPGERMRAQRLRYADAEREFLAAVPEDLRFFFRELVRLTAHLHDPG